MIMRISTFKSQTVNPVSLCLMHWCYYSGTVNLLVKFVLDNNFYVKGYKNTIIINEKVYVKYI